VTERATIIAIDGSEATLQCFEHQGCAKCGSAFCNVNARTYRATISAGLDAHVGDQADVFVPPAKAVAAGFSVLILPLVLFIGGYFALQSTGSEPLQVLGGFAGLAAGFALLWLRARNRPQELPRVVAISPAPSVQPLELGS